MQKAKLQSMPKLHLVCNSDDLRIGANHVLVTKTEVAATDFHTIVIHKTENIFDPDFIEKMPERFLIHKEVWKQIYKGHVLIGFENNLIKVYKRNYNVFFPIVLEDTLGVKFPDYNSLFDKKSESVAAIGLNPDYLRNVIEAMFHPSQTSGIKMEFHSANHYITITPLFDDKSRVKGILMPMMINDNDY